MNAANSRPQVVAHRGASGTFPENTLPAFENALSSGANWIELDVSTTADQRIVVSHDTTVDRCTDGHGQIRDMTLSEIQALDAGSWFGPQFRGLTIPTLESVFDLILGTPAGVVIEVKGDSEAEYEDTALASAALAEAHGLQGRYVIESFNARCLKAVKGRYPSALTGFDLEPRAYDPRLPPDAVIEPALACQADIINQHREQLTPAVANLIHRYGRTLWTWTINEISDLDRVKQINVDGVVTDYPARIVAALGALA